MRAVVLNDHGNPEKAFELKEVDKPKYNANQVLVKVEAFGLNFADVLARKGLYPDMPPKPCVLGYEVVGRVEATGSEASPDLIGKRVVAFTRFGGYAEYAATDHRALAVISESYDFGKALALATQYTTAYVCFHESLVLHKGDKVLVHAAAGGVGIALCQMALAKGCEVFATAGSAEKLDFLKDLGVQHPINYRESDYSEAIKKILNGGRIDATFNSLAGESAKKDMKLLGSGGKMVIFGAASRVGGNSGFIGGLQLLFKTGFFTPLKLIMSSKGIIGVNILRYGDNKPELIASCLKKVVELAEAGTLNPQVHQRFSIEDLNSAHSALENRGTIGKVVVHW